MNAGSCPNCGCQRSGGEECLRCGIVFAKYFTRAQFVEPPPLPSTEEVEPSLSGGLFRSLFRVGRWVALAASVMAIYLLVQPAPAPIVEFQLSAAQSAEVKIRNFKRAGLSGRQQRLRLSEAELNVWLETSLQADAAQADAPSVSVASPEAGEEVRIVEESLAAVRDIRVKLIEDRIRAYVRFALYGKLMSLELEGRLSARDGFLHLEPVAGRLGSFPLPSLTLVTALDRLSRYPQGREVFRMPDYVRALDVDGGQLVVNFD